MSVLLVGVTQHVARQHRIAVTHDQFDVLVGDGGMGATKEGIARGVVGAVHHRLASRDKAKEHRADVGVLRRSGVISVRLPGKGRRINALG